MKIDNNSLDNNKIIEEFFKSSISKEVLSSSSLGKNGSFSIVLESLLGALGNSSNNLDSLNSNIPGVNLGSLESGLKDLTEGIEFRNLNNSYIDKTPPTYSYKASGTPYSNGKVIVKDQRILDAIEKYSKKYNMDKDLIIAVIKQESDFNPNCVSHAGAMGLMQLMPENCTEYGVSNPYNIEQNIDAGIRHLKDMINIQKGNLMLGLASYNAGPGTLRRRGVTTVEGISKLPSETRNYVKKVMKYYKG